MKKMRREVIIVKSCLSYIGQIKFLLRMSGFFYYIFFLTAYLMLE
jgi:hypothetical protein